MYSKSLEWKAFSVDIPTVDAWLRGAFESYAGNSADVALHLWFSEVPSEEDLAAIDAYWGAIDEESDAAMNYLPHSTFVEALETLKAGLISKDWNDMSQAERKLVVGAAVTRADLGL